MGRVYREEGKENLVKKEEWTETIKAACEEAGTYQDFFDLFIDQLAEIMEIRDNAKGQYEKSGGNPVVAYTNKGGHTNLRKNPALAVINECNQQALAYWRDLGLTPSGFKKIDGKAAEKKDATFEDLLSGIGV